MWLLYGLFHEFDILAVNLTMSHLAGLLKRGLITIHRWLGVALSAIFLLWFASGIVIMYWGFPEVTDEDRLARAGVLDPARIRVTVDEAYAALGRGEPPTHVRMTSFDGRPVYDFAEPGGSGGAGRDARVFADDGTVHRVVDVGLVDRAAARWTGRPASEAHKELVADVDQWTVGSVRRQLPLHKYSWPDGQQVYVNGETGQVAQYTTTASRLWAYLGAIPHWLYFTPLRKHQAEWFTVVVWSSLIGTGTALVGLVLAVWMYSPTKRYQHAGTLTSIPYRGWKRWHTMIGLCFGVVTVTWTFSGLLSMGPFPILDRLTDLTVPSAGPVAGREGEADHRGAMLGTAVRGGLLPLSSYGDKPASAAIAAVPDVEVRELEYTSFEGTPLYLASNGRGQTRLIPVQGEPQATFEPDDIMARVRQASGDRLAELRLMHEYDAYYLDRRGQRPLPVVYARLNDPVGTRYYVDPKTATVVGSYSARYWVNRWLYHGLHSLDVPWLYRHRPLWDIVVLTLMLGGTALCVTSIVLTWRVVARKLAVVLPGQFRVASEDLVRELRR